MSQVQIDNKVVAFMRAGTAAFQSASPNTGEGVQGEWPPPGDHDLYILSASEKEGTFNDGARKVACAEVQFEFEWIRNPNDPTWDKAKDPGPLQFKGERFQLIDPGQLVEDGAKTKARINWDRFKGHLCKILSISKEECTDPMARYLEVKQKLAQNRIAVSAKIDYRTWESKKTEPGQAPKKGVNKTEYITGNITG